MNPLTKWIGSQRKRFINLCHNEWVLKTTSELRITTATLGMAEEETSDGNIRCHKRAVWAKKTMVALVTKEPAI